MARRNQHYCVELFKNLSNGEVGIMARKRADTPRPHGHAKYDTPISEVQKLTIPAKQLKRLLVEADVFLETPIVSEGSNA